MSRAGRPSRGWVVLRGLIALVGILLILVGLPTALVVLGGNPLPSDVPTVDEVLRALTRPDDGTLLIGVITVVGWLVWATLALSFLVEIPAAIRGVPAPRLPGLSWQQGRAAAMTGAVMAMLAVGAAGAAPASAAPDQSPATAASPSVAQQVSADTSALLAGHVGIDTASSDPGANDTSGTGSDSAGTGGAAGQFVTVRSGDTLWEIAEEELGEGQRYTEIAEGSSGLTQPDGARLVSPDEIRPGWRVSVPVADAAISTPGATTSTSSEHAAPPQDATSTFADDAGSDRADSTSDAVDTASADHGDSAQHDAVAEALDDELGHAGGAPTTGAEPSTSAADTVPSGSSATTRSTTSSPVSGESADGESRVTVEDEHGPSAAGGLGLLAGAGVLALVEAARRRQRRSRRPGWRVVLPSDAAQRTESWLRAAADPAGHADLDAALSDLAARCSPGRLPSLRAARLGDADIEVYVVEEHLELPGPWVAAGGGTWVLDRNLVTTAHGHRPTPWPSLVMIGEDEGGARIFVNLDEIGALELAGDREEAHAVLTALAVDLATSDRPGRVTVIGALAELVEAVADPRLTHSAAPAEVLARLEQDTGEPSVPEVLLVAAPLRPEEVQRLRGLLARAGRGRLSVVSTTRGVADWSLVVERRREGLAAVLAPVGLSLRPAAVSPPGYDELIELIRSASRGHVPGPAWTAGQDVDPLTLDTVPRRRVVRTPRADDATTRISRLTGQDSVQVRVLGAVQVTAPGTAPRDEAAATELAGLLALHPGSDLGGLAAALGRTPDTVATTLRDVDAWCARSGRSGLLRAGGQFSLDGALVDWQQLRSLISPAVATADSADVRAALTLVTGPPLDETEPGRYHWAAADRAEISAAVADIAHELAQRCLREGDPDGAQWAARKGLLADPLSETLWRDALHASWQSEHGEESRRTVERARRVLGDDGALEEETTFVLDRLGSGVPRAHRA
ncbi:LysM peptidoglycan-binding domain-containing protein [Janibacter anophelis]|uniref:LysM peptidoglycan-binding domain-containing protein n=1 Tax=Janibacter anophelis TaxID=319054 RepID=UPI0013B066A4|nr:BTAD domain-containing putative transcriptional regulator [Janibacter anophelis]